MARTKVAPGKAPEEEGEKRVAIPHDVANEAAVLAAMIVDRDARVAVARRAKPETFVHPDHAALCAVILELHRAGLDVDIAAIRAHGTERIAQTAQTCVEAFSELPRNLEWHVENLLWDATRLRSAKGPVTAFLEALRDAKREPAEVLALARQVSASFEGWRDRRHILDPVALAREAMIDVERRASGDAVYPYGIPDLDLHSPDQNGDREQRMLPGSAPKEITLLTGVSGGGKSTTAFNIGLGIAGYDFETGAFAEKFRRIVWGSWEMPAKNCLQIMAGITLGWSRRAMTKGKTPSTHEEHVLLEERMHLLSKRITFFDNPFRHRRGAERVTVDRNLDLVEAVIADSGCQVFVGDLWARLLPEDAKPGTESYAMNQAQAMFQDLDVHGILLHQINLKELEDRPDKRPSRTVAKGSASYIEVPDTVIGVHFPALFKKVDRDKIQLIILKQRRGVWPLAVEFDWDPDKGRLLRGRDIDYDRPGEANEVDLMGAWPGAERQRKKARGPR